MIKVILHVTNSKRNKYGNCYHFASLQRTSDSAYLAGSTGNCCNVVYWLREAGLEWNEISSHTSELPIRQFNAATKTLDFLSQEIVCDFVKGEVNAQTHTNAH